MSTLDIIRLMRPQQWAKNIFVFLPVFFDGQVFHVDLLWRSLLTFLAFCLMASAVYCFNDIYDVESDRKHPQKSKRPIASGKVSAVSAYILMGLCVAASLAVAAAIPAALRTGAILVFYILLNIAYCTWLKNKALIDVFIIALGFVLRVFAGGTATAIMPSHWMIIMTFLLALFLAFAKRRDDVVIYADTGVKARRNINRYNLEFMNQAITIVATITLVAYIMYTLSPDVIARIGSPYIYCTSIFVLLGILRYMQLTIVDVKSGSPTKVLMRDRFIQCCIIGWLLMFAFLLY